jgi:hypothetical protein
VHYNDEIAGALCCFYPGTQMLTMQQLIARRLGRIVFGAVLVAGVAALTTMAWAGGPRYWGHRWGPHWPNSAQVIGLAWFAALMLGALVRFVAGRVRWSCEPEALFGPSLIVPTAGIALLAPITLHLPFALLISGTRGFDQWVEASLWITAIAHIAFAGMSMRRAHRLIAERPAPSPRRIYLITVLVSCVPFIVLWGIPPVLVALTAAPFVPLLHHMQRMVDRERTEIAAITQSLPRAIAVAAPGA